MLWLNKVNQNIYWGIAASPQGSDHRMCRKVSMHIDPPTHTLTSTICRTCFERVSPSRDPCLPAAHSENLGSWSTTERVIELESRDRGSRETDNSSRASSSMLAWFTAAWGGGGGGGQRVQLVNTHTVCSFCLLFTN